MKIAYIASNGLGDGVIQSLIAQNISKLGHEVTYYHDLIGQLAPIFTKLEVALASSLTTTSMADFDWLLIDKGYKGLEAIQRNLALSKKAVIFSMSKTKPHKKQINSVLFNAPVTGENKFLHKFNGACIRSNKHWSKESVASQSINIFRGEASPSVPDARLSLSIPEEWYQKKAGQRVLIHPKSSSESKNWPANNYIQLAELIREFGLDPVFTMAPSELDAWSREKGAENFKCEVFDSIYDLAKFYFRSSLFIGNDSGNGHLASLLDLPTITVYHKAKGHFPWRPSWGENTIIKPSFLYGLIGSGLWKKSITTKQVYQSVMPMLVALQQMVQEENEIKPSE